MLALCVVERPVAVALVVLSLIGRSPDRIVAVRRAEVLNGVDGVALRSGGTQYNVGLVLVD